MPIEFHCPGCQRILRVPDETAGKQAKCPQCGAVSTIPAPPSAKAEFDDNGAASREMPPLSPADTNPYRAPGMPSFANEAVEQRPAIRLSRLTFGEVWNQSYELWRLGFNRLTVLSLVVLAILFAVIIALVIPLVFLQNRQADWTQLAILQFAAIPIVNAVTVVLYVGLFRCLLAFSRGHEIRFEQLFHPGSAFLPLYVVAVVLGVVGTTYTTVLERATIHYGIVAQLMQIPYFVTFLILGLVYGQYFILVADRGMSLRESLVTSQRITAGNRATFFGVYFVSSLIACLGFMFCCVGIVFAFPLSTLMLVVTYQRMCGEGNAHL